MVIDQRISTILNKITNIGYEAVIIGGFVRDQLLDIVSDDYDLATNAPIEEVAKLFKTSEVITIDNKQIMLVTNYEGLRVEISRYRTETYSNTYDRLYIEFTNDLETDLARRDFTINAIAYDGNTLIDHLHGVSHIESKTLKVIGNYQTRFKEDPMRMLRALRFMAVLNLAIDDLTAKYINENFKQFLNLPIAYDLFKIISGPYFNQVLNKFPEVFAYMSNDLLQPMLKSDQQQIINKRDLLYYLVVKQQIPIDSEIIQKLQFKKKDIEFLSKYSHLIHELRQTLTERDVEILFATFGDNIMNRIYTDFTKFNIILQANINFISTIKQVGYLKISDLAIRPDDLHHEFSIKYKYAILKQVQLFVIRGYIKNDKIELLSYVNEVF